MRGRKTELAHELRLGAPLEVEVREVSDQPPRLGCQGLFSYPGSCRGHGYPDCSWVRKGPLVNPTIEITDTCIGLSIGARV